MSKALRGVVISHGVLGEALVDAVRRINGDADALVAVSNEGCSRATLQELVEKVVGDSPCVVFVDLPAGSCFQAAARVCRNRATMTVVSGVNLAMLLDFVHHVDSTPEDAAGRALKAAERAVQVIGV